MGLLHRRSNAGEPPTLEWIKSNCVENAETGCWEWQGARDKKWGYGLINYLGRPNKAHRLAYQLAGADIPPGLVVRHKCDRPECCCPSHLVVGTHSDNAQDKVQRGRSAQGEKNWNAKLTDDDIRWIRSSPVSGVEKSKKFGISSANVSNIMSGKRWSHVPSI